MQIFTNTPPFWVLIPARLASSRLPNKPLALIGNLPMIVRVAKQAALSNCTKCVVATDDHSIQQTCTEHGIEAILTRSDHLSGSDRLAEACTRLCIPENTIVVNVQGDEPLIPPDLICSVASLLHQQQDCVMATAAHPILSSQDFYNPNVVKVVVDQKNRALYFSRAPIPWWRDRPHNSHLDSVSSPPILPDINRPLRHIGIYAYRSSFLQNFPQLQPSSLEQIESLEQLRVLSYGHRIAVHITNEPPPGGVDTPEDLARVRTLIENKIQKL